MVYADEWGMRYANPTILALNPEMAVSNEKPCKKKTHSDFTLKMVESITICS
jgi:hypothetical protein